MSKSFVWAADPDKIVAAVKSGHHVLDSIHYGPKPRPSRD
jgi:hypothetical protein